MSQFAVVVKVELPEGRTIEDGRKMLEAVVIPDVKSHPGFVTGYWLAPPTGLEGLSFVIYKDEASARTAAEGVKPPPPVKLVDVEVREVAASA
jgi:hypothetical protein